MSIMIRFVIDVDVFGMVEFLNEIIEIGGIMVYMDFIIFDYFIGCMVDVSGVFVWYIVLNDMGVCVGF